MQKRQEKQAKSRAELLLGLPCAKRAEGNARPWGRSRARVSGQRRPALILHEREVPVAMETVRPALQPRLSPVHIYSSSRAHPPRHQY